MSQVIASQQLSTKQKFLATLALCLATFMFVLDYTIANVAVPYIAGALATSAELGTYVITFFAVGNALGLPITGWLSKRLGAVSTLVLSIILFTIFSILCGLSQSLIQIVVFRFFQGLSAGPIVPLSQHCITMVFSKKKITQAMAIFSMVVLTAPVFGPIVGGILCTNYTWPWIFFINIPIGIFCVVIIYVLLMPFENEKQEIGLDKLGFFLLLVGSTSLQIILDKGEQWDWWNSHLIRILVIFTILSYFYLFINCRMKKEPLMDLNLLKKNSFSLAIFALFFIYGIYIATVVIVPFWLQIYMGYTAYLAGLAVCTIGICPVLFSMLVIKLIEKIGCLLTVVIGVFFMGIASFITMSYTTNVDIGHIAFSRAFVGFGLLFWIPPLFKLAMIEFEVQKLPMALGMLHYFRALSSGIGTSICMTIFKRRTIFHHQNLISTVNEYKQSSKEAINRLKSLSFSDIQSDELINMMIDKQAAMLSFNDIFYVMGIAFFILCVILLLFYKKLGHFR